MRDADTIPIFGSETCMQVKEDKETCPDSFGFIYRLDDAADADCRLGAVSHQVGTVTVKG